MIFNVQPSTFGFRFHISYPESLSFLFETYYLIILAVTILPKSYVVK